MHLKQWVYVAIDTICCKIASITPNIAYVTDAHKPGHTVKAGRRALANLTAPELFRGTPSVDSWMGQYDGNHGYSTSRLDDLYPQIGFSDGGHSFLTVGEYRSKALSVVKPHEELEPLEANHFLRRLIDNPNPFDTPFDLEYELQMFEELCGVSYEWLVPNEYGVPCERWCIPSHWVWPRTGGRLPDGGLRSRGKLEHVQFDVGQEVGDYARYQARYVNPNDPHADELIQYYEVRPWGGMGSAGILRIPPNEIVRTSWKSPINKIDGYSKLTAGAMWIDEEESIVRSRWSQQQNQARPELWIELGQGYEDPNDPRIHRMEAKIMSKLQGEFNYGKPLVTPPGAKVTPLSFSPTEMAYFQSEEQCRDMVLSLWRVPKTAVGISNDMTFGSILATLASLCEYALNPRLVLRGQVRTKFLASRWDEPDTPSWSTYAGPGGGPAKGRKVRLWYDNTVPADPNQVNSDIQVDISGQAICPDEIRAMRGRKSWPKGGDTPYVSGPGGMIPLPVNGDDLAEYARLTAPVKQPPGGGMPGMLGMGGEGGGQPPGLPSPEGQGGAGGMGQQEAPKNPELDALLGQGQQAGMGTIGGKSPGSPPKEPNSKPTKDYDEVRWDDWFSVCGLEKEWRAVKTVYKEPALRERWAHLIELNRIDKAVKDNLEEKLVALGEELAHREDPPRPMPGYGQIFVNNSDLGGHEAEVWYVGGDGDETGFHKLVERRIREIWPAVGKVTYEAEGFPPDDGNWRQVYPKKERNKSLVASGLAVRARDTGRLLMLRRAVHAGQDQAAGEWEFPGGHLEANETPPQAAHREWQEEVGLILEGAELHDHYDSPNGKYRLYVAEIPSENQLDLDFRHQVENPDGDIFDGVYWIHPREMAARPLRHELRQDLELLHEILPTKSLGQVRKQLEERELLNLPDVRQPDHFSCGAACAMTVGKYFGVGPKTLEEWKRALGTSEQRSTQPSAIIAYLKSLGLQVEARQGMTLDDLAECWSEGKPVICPIQEYGVPSKQASYLYGHYVVVIGRALGKVFVFDPSIDNALERPGGDIHRPTDPDVLQTPGDSMIDEDTWNKVWHDKDVDGNTYKQYGIIVSQT